MKVVEWLVTMFSVLAVIAGSIMIVVYCDELKSLLGQLG
jgi:hypothetical protein